MKTNLKKLEKSQVEIKFELTAEEFQKYLEATLKNFQKTMKVDGFREGQVPLKMVEERVGNEKLLMEAGDLAVKKSYEKFVKENNLEPIDRPEVQILKVAKGSPFEFKVKVSILPEIKLPDYKKIAADTKSNEIKVEAKEIEDTLSYLQKTRAKFQQVERGAQKNDFVEIIYWNEHINKEKEVNPVRNKTPEASASPQADWISNGIKDAFILGEGGFLKDFEDNILGMKAGEEKEFSAKFPENAPQKELAGRQSNFKVKMNSVKEMELTKIDDEFAKGLGDFKDLEALKTSLQRGIEMEKQMQEKQRKRQEILEKIIQKIDLPLPENMIAFEQQNLIEEFKNQLAQSAKIDFEQYLSSIKKNEQEFKELFKPQAEKRLKSFLVLREIGKAENIEVSPQEIEEETNKTIKNYLPEQLQKSFGSIQDGFDIDKIKEYIKGNIFNEKVFQVLEKFSQTEELKN